MASKKSHEKHVRGRKRAARARRRKAPQAESPRAIPKDAEEVRLNRFIARAGVSSRRGADDLIAAGRVRVDGKVVTEMGTKVAPNAEVEVDGKPIAPAGLVTLLLNKPSDTITTTDDDRGRRTVMDLIDIDDRNQAALFPVGRLDRGTTGLLLLTTDGKLAHRLMHPRYEVEKVYVVTTAKPVAAEQLDQLRSGVSLDDGPAAADHAGYVDPEAAGIERTRVALQIHEGRNRQVRRMMEALGHEVTALERIRYAGLTLDGVKRGRWRRLTPHEVNTLRRSVKLKPIVF